MATLSYGGEVLLHIDDRALSHLKAAITAKLRRHESFTLSWVHREGEPKGRSTIWLHPSIALRFTFDSADSLQLNAEWVERIMRSANSTGGIHLIEDINDGPNSRPATALNGGRHGA